MKLSVHLVTGGKYIRAGDPLPPGFELPSHLEAFVVDPSQISRATSIPAGGDSVGMRGSEPARSAADDERDTRYPEFIPKWKLKKRRDEERKKL
jgi:hypothetical protein